MNSILFFLFLGASVALAELPCDEDVPGQLADEENGPFEPPSLPPFSVGSVFIVFILTPPLIRYVCIRYVVSRMDTTKSEIHL